MAVIFYEKEFSIRKFWTFWGNIRKDMEMMFLLLITITVIDFYVLFWKRNNFTVYLFFLISGKINNLNV